ncbi:ribonuclease Z [Sarracenia purpurea var. burkii]
MQRNSAAVRHLFYYKGQLDPLKGDALNKAVVDTAHEAMSAIFSADENKLAPAEALNNRIEGFGNPNFELPSEGKRSFISEVVGIGSATIKQGLSSLTRTQSLKKNETGSYKGPNLHRSLTTEFDYPDGYEHIEGHSETQASSLLSKNDNATSWGQDLRINQTETASGDASSSHVGNKSREERLLETIVKSGGVRLQPTRDSLLVFLVEASKLDALALSHALESKLKSHLWQVRMKALCVLEAILRKKDDEQFSIVASYFSQDKDDIVRCSESPQASLREKSNKVLSLLDGEQTSSGMGYPEKAIKPETTAVQMPDLIDTSNPDDMEELIIKMENDQHMPNTKPSTAPRFSDLFGDSLGTDVIASEWKNNDDPFSDVSFHTNDNKKHVADIFLGMNVDKPGQLGVHMAENGNGSEPFDIFRSDSQIPWQEENHKKDVHDLMAGLSINGNASRTQQKGASPGAFLETIFPESTINPNHEVSNNLLNGILGSQATGMNTNSMFPLSHMGYNIPPGLMFNPAFPSQPVNYGAMGSFFTQQQFLTTMLNFQQLGNLQFQNVDVTHAAGAKGGAYSSPLPEIFNPNIPTQTPSSMMNSLKTEETKAFDFISAFRLLRGQGFEPSMSSFETLRRFILIEARVSNHLTSSASSSQNGSFV